MTDNRKVIIRGIPHIPTIREINSRLQPTTSSDVVVEVPVGAEVLKIHEVQPDREGSALNGKIYQWFKMTFTDGSTGWVRDDLLELQGDFSPFGYRVYGDPVFAFDQQRAEVVAATTAPTVPATPAAPPPAPVAPVQPTVPPAPMDMAALDDIERVRTAAFAVTAAFEGKGYDAYQNYDSGVISYGRFQFTLDAGSLGTIVTRYLERASSPVAHELRQFHPAIVNRDHGLRNNTRLKELLLAAAAEDVMKQVQNDLAREAYWDRMLDISARPRGIQSPLGLALLFDIAINFGVMNALLGLAEKELNVPPKSRVGQNGVTEQQFIAQVADRRKRGHYAQAARDNLPGLRVRGDFWVDLASKGDWNFAGDAQGNVNVNGKSIQVRNPSKY